MEGIAQVGWSVGRGLGATPFHIEARPTKADFAHRTEVLGPGVDGAEEFADEGTGAPISVGGHGESLACRGFVFA